MDRAVLIGIILSASILGAAFILAPVTAGREMNIPPTNAFSKIISHSGSYNSKSYHDTISMDWPYAQISDSITQGTTQGAAVNVTLNTNDSLYHVTHSTTTRTNEIVIQDSGVYQIIAVAQVGESGIQANGVHDFWMMKNNIQISNSNVKTTVMLQVEGSETMTSTINWIGYLKRNDIISFQQSSDDSDIGIVASVAGIAPTTPSVIISIAKISY